MDNNFGGFDDFGSDGFDDFNGGFNSDGGFGSNDPFDTSDGFEDNQGGFNGGFDGNTSQNSFSDDGFSDGFDDGFSNNQMNTDNQFSNNDFPENPVDNAGVLSKKSYIMIAVGVGVLILVIIIASAITKAARKKNTEQAATTEVTQEVVQEQPKQPVNADDLMATQPQQPVQEQPQTVEQPQNNKVINNVKEGGTVWTEITSDDAANVTFKDGLTDMMFTITGIEHKARAVDASETLVVKTTLTGSISGLPGTYEIDVPFDKGVKLQELGIGTQFTVHVQLGEFKGRTVVGNITY